MSDKINLKELEVMIANIVKEIGVNDVFTEEMNKKIQEKIKNKVNSERIEIVQEEEEDKNTNLPSTDTGEEEISDHKLSSEMPNLNAVPEDAKVMINPELANQVSNTDMEPDPQLPSFIEKAEPGQIFVFDNNELSFGGENLANRPFRLLSNPDQKKSIHQMWMDEGKIRADVYMVKFEKLGQMIFNPFNGSAKLEEKRFNPELNNIAQPFNENPHEPIINSEDNIKSITPETNRPANEIEENELETKVYDIITKFLKGSTIHAATGPVGINIPAITAGQIENPEPEDEDTLSALKKEEPIMENTFKMIDLINGEFEKIDTPKELIESLRGNSNSAKLIAKNDEVQTWIIENKKYHLPVNIISNRKCYIKTI